MIESVSLALDRDELLHRLVANKVIRGYSLEFTMSSGDSYFGFVTGLDQDQIQIITTPFGQSRGNVEHKFANYDLADGNGKDRDFLQWLSIANIECITENRLALKHFVPTSKAKIEKASRAFTQGCQQYIDAQSDGGHT